MLIWIKAPCVAIGVLASFVLLLSTVVSEQVELNLTSEDPDITSAYSSEDSDSLLLMSLPFAHSLSNPCSWEGTFRRPSQITIVGHRTEFMDEFYRLVAHYARNHKDDALKMLQNHTITGCSLLGVRNLPHTPTHVELEEMDMDEALNKIYLSLLVHSAYSYFIHHQFTTSNLRCSGNIQGEESLANQSSNIALKLKTLACYIRVGMSVLGYEQDDVLPLLNDTISDLSLCSRRALRDCQVMKSMYYFLDMVSVYAAAQISESSTTLPYTKRDKR